MKITPLGNRILVEVMKSDNKTTLGIYLPEGTTNGPQSAKVLAVGPGDYSEGRFIETTINVGDTILFQKYSGMEIKLNSKELLILRESDIVARVEE